jgi:DNA-directed RNA polymerase specialized sigma24 family protein
VASQSEQLAEHWGAMMRSARSVLGSRDEAEECAGQALLQVCEQDVSNVLNMEAYMVTVAKRRAIDRLRNLERSRRRDQLLGSQDRLLLNDPAEDVAQRSEARWMAGEAARLLDARSLDVLTRYAEGEAIASIAVTHDLTEGAARTVLHRARKLLREVYAKSLAVLGLGWLAGRRTGPAAPAAVTLAAVVFVLSPFLPAQVGPTPGVAAPPSGNRLTLESASSPAALPVAASATLVLTVLPPPAAAAPEFPRTPAPLAHEVVAVSEPMGAKTVITRRQRGDHATYDDPATVLVDCLKNFRLTASQIGC